jgi:WD40 repeat protein
MNSGMQKPFFIAGGNLPLDAPSYISRRADDDLYESLLRGDFCYVLTSRQMGKSSLMVRTIARMQEADVAAAVVDLSAIGHDNLTVEQWYFSLLMRISRRLNFKSEMENFWKKSSWPTPLQKFFNALQYLMQYHVTGPLVIFIDEIDQVQALSFSTDDFFAAIRNCYNRRSEDPEFQRLTFCLLGVASPSDLISNSLTTPFNIGTRIELRDFTLTEMKALAEGLRCDQSLKQVLLKRVHYWTNGHPYLTQRLCRAVSEACEQAPYSASSIDALCQRLFLSPEARERDDNLTLVRDRLLKSREDIAELLTCYHQILTRKWVPDQKNSPIIDTLHLSGIVRTEADCLRPRNRIYAHVFDVKWVRENMPDVDLRRQRTAYRKGLLRGICAVVPVVVFAAIGLQKAREARLQYDRAEDYNYAMTMRSAQQAWMDGSVRQTQEFLDSVTPRPGETDRRGFEWYYFHRLLQALPLSGLSLSVAYSPDGRLLAATDRHDIQLWNTATREKLTRLKGHTDWVYPLVFLDNKTLASAGGKDRTIRLWDVTSGRQIKVFKGFSSVIFHMDFSPDRNILAVGQGKIISLRNAQTGQKIAELTGHKKEAYRLSFSPNGEFLASCSVDGEVLLWDVTRRKLLGPIMIGTHGSSSYSIAFYPKSEMLATGDYFGKIRLWNVATRKEIRQLPEKHTAQVFSLAFSPDGKTLASASWDNTIVVWDVISNKSIRILKGHKERVCGLAFSPDGKSLASSSEGELRIWNPYRNPEFDTLPIDSTRVSIATFSSDKYLLGFVGGDGLTELRDYPSGTLRARWRGLRSKDSFMGLSPDAKTLAAVELMDNSMIRLWDVTSNRSSPRQIDSLRLSSKKITALAFSPDGNHLAIGSDDTPVQIWNRTTRLLIRVFHVNKFTAYSVVFSPDGRYLAYAGGNPGVIRLWDVAAQREAGIFVRREDHLDGTPRRAVSHSDHIFGLAFSKDSKKLASCGWDRVIRLWNVVTREEIATLHGHSDQVRSVAFSPDGKTLASGSDDKTVRLWNVETQREVARLNGNRKRVYSVAFTLDGKTLITASEDAVLLWHGDKYTKK